ncbi:uncharacterized protein LOC114322996 [Camellia sinensis]|uniref:uncharacterized protein LOC114322996 n=1 Tax=Camellia sinensis TaxID=4442 RepID=UPI0010362EEE|nr:uncharacterized protein LOC114322996 [Camellia sinensis]
MALWSENGQLPYKMFPSIFWEIALDGFHKLPKGCVKSWEGLAKIFVARFVTNRLQPLRVDSLLALKINDGESLRAYAKRYYEVYNRIPACNLELAVVSFKNGSEDDYLLQQSLANALPRTWRILWKGLRSTQEWRRSGKPERPTQ